MRAGVPRGARVGSSGALIALPPRRRRSGRRPIALRMRDVLHEGDQVLGRADLGLGRLQRDPAAIEHDEALGDVEDVVDVVADEQRSSGRSARTWRTKWNTLSVSVSDSAVVGSSSTIRSALL